MEIIALGYVLLELTIVLKVFGFFPPPDSLCLHTGTSNQMKLRFMACLVTRVIMLNYLAVSQSGTA